MITKDLGCYLPRILRDHENSVGARGAAQGFVDSPPGYATTIVDTGTAYGCAAVATGQKPSDPDARGPAMDQITIRRTSADLPVFDEEVDLEPVSSLGTEGVTLEHVVFIGCKLDYATLDQIRATGPVLFVRCSLREAEFTACDLADSLFDDCDLRLTDFGRGSYRGCDLRGNDLSAVSGAHHLKRVVIDRAQLMHLAEALAVELDVTFGDDVPDRL
jgi:uncharacterized protein YjbI with pentapeptide repeats